MIVQPDPPKPSAPNIAETEAVTRALVAVGVRLVRALDLDADVLGLLGGERGQLGTELRQVEAGDLLVQNLRQRKHPVSMLTKASALCLSHYLW